MYPDRFRGTVNLDMCVEARDLVNAGFIGYCEIAVIEDGGPEGVFEICAETASWHAEKFSHGGNVVTAEAEINLE